MRYTTIVLVTLLLTSSYGSTEPKVDKSMSDECIKYINDMGWAMSEKHYVLAYANATTALYTCKPTTVKDKELIQSVANVQEMLLLKH